MSWFRYPGVLAPGLGRGKVPGSEFKISSERIDGRVELISIGGELDLSVAVSARDYLAVRMHDPEISSLVLDLSDLRFIDSSGLHTVVQAARSADDLGRRLVLVGSGPQVRRVLDLTGVAAFLTLVDKRDEALALLR